MRRNVPWIFAAGLGVLSCTSNNVGSSGATPASAVQAATLVSGDDKTLPADAEHVALRLLSSPRHGEWAMIRTTQGDSVKAWVVYPERRNNAPVVVVVHEIYGLSTWARGVADQLAAAGFIAIAPDLLTMSNTPRVADTLSMQDATSAIRTLKPDVVQRQLDAVAAYGMALPSAQKRYGVIGFCWGGGVSFAHAAHAPRLGASVVYYGVSPSADQLKSVRAPVLGLYAGSDARVDATYHWQTLCCRRWEGRTYTTSTMGRDTDFSASNPG